MKHHRRTKAELKILKTHFDYGKCRLIEWYDLRRKEQPLEKKGLWANVWIKVDDEAEFQKMLDYYWLQKTIMGSAALLSPPK